jgi:hypothetical protein
MKVDKELIRIAIRNNLPKYGYSNGYKLIKKELI